jgi:type IV conjugative transfer system protein TraE
MKPDFYRQTWNKAIASSKHAQFLNYGLLLIVAILGFTLASNNQRVVVVPPTLASEGWVESNAASQSMQEAWAEFLAVTIGNVTPRNIDRVMKSIGENLSPRIYQAVLTRLVEQSKTVKDEQVSISFEPTNTRFDAKTGNVLVTGRSRITGTRGASSETTQTYEMRFVVSNYRVLLDHFERFEGSKPDTEEQ